MTQYDVSLIVNSLISTARGYRIRIKDICKETGLHRTSIRRWQEGMNIPSYENFLKLQEGIQKLLKKKGV